MFHLKYAKPQSKILPYIDRICYRLPDNIQTEGGLKLHIDINPYDINPFNLHKHKLSNVKLKKIKPLQSFIALTDCWNSESGGLNVIKGFHKKFDTYFTDQFLDSDTNIGEFYRFNDKSHAKLLNQLEPVLCSAGSMVLWDSRLPHSTAEKLLGFDTREVIYQTYLPSNEINDKYYAQQYENYCLNIRPPSYIRMLNDQLLPKLINTTYEDFFRNHA